MKKYRKSKSENHQTPSLCICAYYYAEIPFGFLIKREMNGPLFTNLPSPSVYLLFTFYFSSQSHF